MTPCRPGPLTRRRWLMTLSTTLLLVATAAVCSQAGESKPSVAVMAKAFAQPPPEAQPWVYWFWLSGNITSNGITADLEAMKRVGIGGALIMEVDQGAPTGPVDFMGPAWRGLFRHALVEAKRVGIELNLNNDAGWNGSGGPWIRPEQSMQKVVWTETNVAGPRRFEGRLAQPGTVAGYYRDIAVLACPASGTSRIDRIAAKAAFEVGGVGPAIPRDLPADQRIDRSRILGLGERVDAEGRLTWDVPEGQWTVLRFGHTSTGVENAPAPASGRGLECDKLSREGVEANFAGMMAKVIDDAGSLAGQSLVATHVDSWENGSQNWTSNMREEFRRRRGYDLTPFLVALTGRAIDSIEISERFLWDLRQTVSELVIECYAGRLRDLAHARGLRFTIEAYGSPCDNLPYAGRADEPMGEFWMGGGAFETLRGMASAAHTYGRPILGAEAFTAGDSERWRDHPGSIKTLGDRAFCAGVNRFVFHRYALQPWADRRPGMTMGPWGLHYERTQTWWDDSKPWHEYLARCQYLLRQGRFVADIAYLQPETPPHAYNDHPRQGYDWDELCPEVVFTRLSVRDGVWQLPDGLSYRLLVIPDTPAMTPALLRRIRDLVREGGIALVSGPPPVRAPGLTDHPACDEAVRQLAAEIWGPLAGQDRGEHTLGAGRVRRGGAAEGALESLGVPADFRCRARLNYIHRSTPDAEVYFVANPHAHRVSAAATFRVAGRVPELWWPDTGRIEPASMHSERAGTTSVVLSLDPGGSVFVAFPAGGARGGDPVIALERDGESVVAARRDADVALVVRRATYGVPGDPQRSRDVRAKLQALVDRGEDTLLVRRLAEDGDPAHGTVKTLVAEYSVGDRQFAVRGQDSDTVCLSDEAVCAKVVKAVYGVLNDPKRTRDMRDRIQRWLDGGISRFQVARLAEGDDPAFLVVKTVVIDLELEGVKTTVRGTDPEWIDLSPQVAAPRVAELRQSGRAAPVLHAWKPGRYTVRTGSGQSRDLVVPPLPAPLDLGAGWELRFPSGWGAPERIVMDRLESLSQHAEAGVRHFSGSAVYRTTFTMPGDLLSGQRRWTLDLGRVEVMADVTLNGHALGLLWRKPYELDVTDRLRPGENHLDVRVVTLWINRMIGDESLPEDSDRNDNGTLRAWPPWLDAGRPSPSGRFTFTSWRLWKKSDALVPSGLIGPVALRPVAAIPLSP